MERELYEEIFNIEAAYWWYTARRRIILKLLKHYLPPQLRASGRPTVCDLGTGCGYNLVALREFYDAKGMDSSSEAIRFSAKRGIEVLPGSLPDDLPWDNRNSEKFVVPFSV